LLFVFLLLSLATIPLSPVFAADPGGVSGTVFEDVNYGGGAGRSLATSSGVVRSGATVELYNAAGAYVSATTTDASGNYSFPGLTAANYAVRVVSSTVTSSRSGYVAGLLPVQTYRTTAISGTAVDVTDYVGGQNPAIADAANGAAGWTVNSSTGVFSGSGSGTAHAIAPVTVGIDHITSVDFGFNFDAIVNTNDSGQGSMRQFILNSNALGGEGSLVQSGFRMNSAGGSQALPTGLESSIFMISDEAAHPGLRNGITNLLGASGVAVITTVTALPVITGTNTALDGSTQTANVGNTNNVLLGAGGTVGVDGLTLGQVAGPEVEIRGTTGLAAGVEINADNTSVRGVSITGFGSTYGILVYVNVLGTLIENNTIGSLATSFADPGAALRNGINIQAAGSRNGWIQNNLISFGNSTGIRLTTTATGWTIIGNEIRDNGLNTSNGDGIAIDTLSTATISGNLICGSSSQAYVISSSSNIFTNNSVTGNGVGISTGVVQSTAITIRTGVTSSLVDRNVVRDNYGAGIQVNSGASGVHITKNSFSNNGTITARNGGAPTGQIGIDLNAPSDNIDLGTSPFVTLNDDGDGDTGGNGLFNFPVLATATIAGGNLVIEGYARPSSIIELFIAAPHISGFGEGQIWKITLTEGGAGSGGNDPYADTDNGTGTYGPGAVNGIIQGTDTTNKFRFTFPKPSGVVAGTRLTATATDGSGNTSEFGANVTVASAVYQPDALIKLASEAAGAYLTDNLYETTATVQSKSQGSLSGSASSYTLQFQNDGNATDSISITGGASGSGFTVQYLDDSAVDRTAAVTGAGYTITGLTAGSVKIWTLNVTPATTVFGGTAYTTFITATSAADTAKKDQVKAITSSTSANITLLKNADKGTAKPGEDISYSTIATNGSGLTSASGIVLRDPIPANTGFKIGSASFAPGTSTLTATISYSNNSGATWTYAPISGGCSAPAGYDYCVTEVRWTMTGSMPTASSFNVGLVTRIK
jgi:uncharacterized repeat protein (TIGR01451 family)